MRNIRRTLALLLTLALLVSGIAMPESQRTAAAVAGQLVYDLLSYDDISFSEKLNMQVLFLDAQTVVSTFRKYWCDARSQWWVMVGPEMKDTVAF